MRNEEIDSSVNLKEIILETAKKVGGKYEISQLRQADPDEVDALVTNLLKMVTDFEELALRHRTTQLRIDTDVVWDIAAAGIFAKGMPELPEDKDRYKDLPWSRGFERGRIRTSAVIARTIASLRSGKTAVSLTREDYLEYAPYLIYAGTPEQQENVRTVLTTFSNQYRLPLEARVHVVRGVKNQDGSFRDVINSVDEVQAFELPEGIIPRRMIIVSHAPHLVRLLHIMGKFHEDIPSKTIIQPYPIASPEKGKLDYTIMEVRGTLAAIYGTQTASSHPYPYQT